MLLPEEGLMPSPFILIMSLSFLLSCAPQGEWKPVLHAPHQTYINQTQGGGAASEPQDSEGMAEGFIRGLPGLPPICKRVAKPKGTICLECTPSPWLVLRCYNYKGKFEADASCQSNAEHLKCLMTQPVSTINLPLKRSAERVFRENYLMWEAKILEIWQERLSPEEEDSLNNLLRMTSELSLWFSQQDPISMKSEDWLRVLPLEPEQAQKHLPRCRQMASQLQSIRLSGHLTLFSFLRSIKALLHDLKMDPKYIEYVDALSIEGLEESL